MRGRYRGDGEIARREHNGDEGVGGTGPGVPQPQPLPGGRRVLTSIQCGAPFAHQLLEYHTCEYPDLVLFGKAVGTHGVAVEWRGSNIKELGIVKDDQREHVMKDWQKLFT